MFKSLAHHSPAPNSYFMAYNSHTSSMFENMLIDLNGSRFWLEEEEFTHYAPIVRADELARRIEKRLQCKLWESERAGKEFEAYYVGERLNKVEIE